MSALLERLGRFCARRRWAVAAAWAILTAALVVGAEVAGVRTSDSFALPGSDSARATSLLHKRFPSQARGSNPIVVATEQGRLTRRPDRRALRRTLDSLDALPVVEAVENPLKNPIAISADRRTAVIEVTLNRSAAKLTDEDAQRVLDATEPAREAGMRTAAGGPLGLKLSGLDPHDSEALAIGFAAVVLLLAFGSVVAMGMPVSTAVVGLLCGFAGITLIGHLAQIPSVAPALATMIGLGVGIDYALFIVSRFRDELAGGSPVAEAVARANATAGAAVLYAGTTVVVALCALVLVGIPLIEGLGLTAAVMVLAAMLAAVTLLPALLALVGRRIDSLTLPWRRGGGAGASRGWARWAALVAARPVAAMLAGAGLLVLLGLPALGMRLGPPDVGAYPESTTARQAYDLVAAAFGPGVNSPLVVAVDLSEARSGESGALLRRRAGELTGTAHRGVAEATPPRFNEDRTAAVIDLIPTSGPASEETEELVHRYREEVIPKATRGTRVRAYVGGPNAAFIDLNDEIADRLPLVIGIVVAWSLVALFLAFRSIVLPLTAALMNLLSIFAAYGVVTAVFENGWGETLVGVDHTIPVVGLVPLVMFAILFGLSTDYQVFLLSRIREQYDRTGDTTRGVIAGLAASARVITSAALIMVLVFLSFVVNGDPTIKQFGLGLAVAVAIDALVVRCLLVPAAMTVLGEANWWLPKWISRRLPALGIEGDVDAARPDAGS